MVSVLFAVALSFVTSEHEAKQTYAVAYEKSVLENKPLVVVVSAGYCPACTVLKDTTIKSLQDSGELDNVSVAVVDKDAEPELAKQLMAGERMVPQIIVFAQSDTGRWKRTKLMGFQPTQPVRSLIRSAMSLGRG